MVYCWVLLINLYSSCARAAIARVNSRTNDVTRSSDESAVNLIGIFNDVKYLWNE